MNVEIWCDGACRGNNNICSNRLGGFGVVMVSGEYIKEMYGWKEPTTNNEMELTAYLVALRALKRYDINLTVYTDSQYMKDGMTKWCANWSKNNWLNGRKGGIKSLELWMEICRIESRVKTFGSVRYIKVKGHSGVPLNERADKLANYAMDKKAFKY